MVSKLAETAKRRDLTSAVPVLLMLGFLIWVYFLNPALRLIVGLEQTRGSYEIFSLPAELLLGAALAVVGTLTIVTSMKRAAWLSSSDYARRFFVILLAALIGGTTLVAGSLTVLFGLGNTVVPKIWVLPGSILGLLYYLRLVAVPILLVFLATQCRSKLQRSWIAAAVIVIALATSFVTASRLAGLVIALPLLALGIRPVSRLTLWGGTSLLGYVLATSSRSSFSLSIVEALSSRNSDTERAGVLNKLAPLREAVGAETTVSPSEATRLSRATLDTYTPEPGFLDLFQGLDLLKGLAARTVSFADAEGLWLQSDICPNTYLSLVHWTRALTGGSSYDSCLSIRESMGISDGAFGGFSPDFFGNWYWAAGGYLPLFWFTCLLIGVFYGLLVLLACSIVPQESRMGAAISTSMLAAFYLLGMQTRALFVLLVILLLLRMTRRVWQGSNQVPS